MPVFVNQRRTNFTGNIQLLQYYRIWTPRGEQVENDHLIMVKNDLNSPPSDNDELKYQLGFNCQVNQKQRDI